MVTLVKFVAVCGCVDGILWCSTAYYSKQFGGEKYRSAWKGVRDKYCWCRHVDAISLVHWVKIVRWTTGSVGRKSLCVIMSIQLLLIISNTNVGYRCMAGVKGW